MASFHCLVDWFAMHQAPCGRLEKLLSNFSKLALMVHKMAKFLRESNGLRVKLLMDRERNKEYDKNISFLSPRG
jgi:hypothetical protein